MSRKPPVRLVRALASMLLVLDATATMAAGRQDSPPPTRQPIATAATVQQRLAEAKERLALSPEQEEKLRTALLREVEQWRAIQARYGTDQSREARRAKLREARALQKEFRASLDGFLSSEQLAEWDRMAAEWRARMRERAQQPR